jgi:hypothetical protein
MYRTSKLRIALQIDDLVFCIVLTKRKKNCRELYDLICCANSLSYQGTNKIQGILVDLPEGDMMCLSSKAFKNMEGLRLFMVNSNSHFSQGSVGFPNELRVIDCPDCPLESLPFNFQGEQNFVILRMHSSTLKGLEGDQVQLLFLGKLCHEILMLLLLSV